MAGAANPAARAGPPGAFGLQAPARSPIPQAVISNTVESKATLISAAPRPAAGIPVYLISTTLPVESASNCQVPPSMLGLWARMECDATSQSATNPVSTSASRPIRLTVRLLVIFAPNRYWNEFEPDVCSSKSNNPLRDEQSVADGHVGIAVAVCIGQTLARQRSEPHHVLGN